jgi:hypothetical protein
MALTDSRPRTRREARRELGPYGRVQQAVNELDERIGQASRARTYGDLDALVADLPPPPPPKRAEVVDETPRVLYRRSLGRVASRWALISLLCVALFFAGGGSGFFWPAWVIIFGVFRVLRVAQKRHYRQRRLLVAQQRLSGVAHFDSRPWGSQ